MFAFATPLTFAAIGGMFSERSGVVNIGLEGMMLTGAFFAVLGADKLGNWALGLVCAVVAGGVAALIHAFVAIHLRADQIVSGTAINFLALGVTGYFFIQVYGDNGTPGSIPQVPNVNIPGCGSRVGSSVRSFGHLNLMIWLSFVLADRLVLRHVQDADRPADSLGRRAPAGGRHRRHLGVQDPLRAVVLSGMLAALGGAYLSIGFVGSFNENMTAGRGFIASRRADLRKLAAVRRVRGCAARSASRLRCRSAWRSRGATRPCSSRRSRTF